jgi:hypothetical protein
MTRTIARVAFAVLISSCLAGLASAAPHLWEQLVPRKKEAAATTGDLTLVQTNGPWLVMATSFSGEAGKEQALELVNELRSEYNLPAFYYGMTFEMEDANPGRGINDYGAPIKRRYNRGESVVEHAVLVGEFPSIDDPEAQKLLTQIKQISPKALQLEGDEESSQSLASVRQYQNAVLEKINPSRKRGPMGKAFLTRNPMLPREYFVPQGVDAEVAKWNEGLEFSLLKCPGRYSIRVATFRGRVQFQSEVDDTNGKTRQAKEKDPLVAAAHNAHKLTVALRAKGWEAYEFHDRQESYVTVGSFDDGQQTPDGRVALTNRDAQTIARTFGAQSPNINLERPAYEQLGVRPEKIRQIEADQQRIQQTFANSLSTEHLELTNGLHPKRLVGLPFDIIPEPVVVPKKSISAAYARN